MDRKQRKEIQDLVALLAELNLTELEVQRGDLRIRVRRDLAAASASSHPQAHLPASASPAEPRQTPAASAESIDKESARLVTVTSPIVGTFYRSASPDIAPYVEEGDLVSRGQVLCIVEAMKLMNEIESEVDGRIVKILVESEAGVAYGQPLVVIDPLSGS